MLCDIKSMVLPSVSRPERIVFASLRESQRQNLLLKPESVKALSDFLENSCEKINTLFGWVTELSCREFVNLINDNPHYFFPHFIVASSGTVLYWFSGKNEPVEDKGWKKCLEKSGFSGLTINSILQELNANSIVLIPYKISSAFKKKFIFDSVGKEFDLLALKHIQNTASKYNSKVYVSGTPEGSRYYIDFVPAICRETSVFQYIIETREILFDNTFAFTSDPVDKEIIEAVKNGYVIKNKGGLFNFGPFSSTQEEYGRYIKAVLSKIHN